MRIAKTGSRRESVAQSRRRKSAPAAPTFGELLQTEQVGELDLAAALREVDAHAQKLKESPVMENLLRYKRKVREVLHYLVKNSYEVQENSFYDPLGRRRLLVVVEKIDEKLEELTRDFLTRHSSPLDLVSRLDEIRGLLLDLEI